MPSTCPFCQGDVLETACTACGRDPTAPRRVCPHCGGMTPTAETACCRCGQAFRSDLRWKVPLIIALFLAAILLSLLL